MDAKKASRRSTVRILRVESSDGSVISSGKFAGSGYPDDHWLCLNAAPAVKWMDGLKWKKIRPRLRAAGFDWQWL
jgi:hypothetical protein